MPGNKKSKKRSRSTTMESSKSGPVAVRETEKGRTTMRLVGVNEFETKFDLKRGSEAFWIFTTRRPGQPRPKNAVFILSGENQRTGASVNFHSDFTAEEKDWISAAITELILLHEGVTPIQIEGL